MKDKHLYQRRTDGDYKGYTEESFYYNSTEKLWCWKQTSTEKIFKAKTLEEIRDIKDKYFKGSGSHERDKGTPLPEGFFSTEEFTKLVNIKKLSKEYISRLLKRASTSQNEYNERGMDRKKRGVQFVNCLKKAGIEYDQIISRRKVWVFKNLNDEKINEFKKLWLS
tara:strand:- start:4032 stop:4529 length:498 start_codon:yes stop_codon:yes gene_type:complete